MSGQMAQTPGTSAGEYETMDPSGFTGQTAANLYGQPAQNMFQRGDAANNAWMMNSQDPGSFMSKYLQDFGQMQGAVTEATSPLATQLNEQMQRNIQTGTTNLGQQLAGIGGLRSSGMGEMAGRFAGEEAAKAGSALANAQLGMLNPMAQNAMTGRQNAYGNMMSQPMDLMNMQANFGSPNYVAPEYYQQPGALEWIGAGADLIGSVGSLMPGL